MTLSNPKPGGYAFGEKLPSAHVNSVWSQLVYALDGNDGGNYITVSPLSVMGAGFGNSRVDSAASFEWRGTNWPRVQSRTVQRRQLIVPVANFNTRWAYQQTEQVWRQTSVADTGPLVIPFRWIDGATVTQIDVVLRGSGTGGSHGSLPATMPVVQFKRTAIPSGGTGGSSQVDTSGSVGAYDAVHTVSITSLTDLETDSGGQVAYIYIFGEAGANSVASALNLHAVTAHFTVTEIRSG